MSFRLIPDPKNRQTILKLDRSHKMAKIGIRRGLFDLGYDLQEKARKNITTRGKTGKLYRIKGRSRRHRSSAPGQAPSNLSGKLKRSTTFQVQGFDRMEFGYDQTAPHGVYVELGSSKMDPRPNLSPTVTEMNANAQGHFERRIANAIRTGK